jgi:hypothetical protein
MHDPIEDSKWVRPVPLRNTVRCMRGGGAFIAVAENVMAGRSGASSVRLARKLLGVRAR